MVARVETLEKECSGYKDFHARRLVETAGHIIITYLLARQAGESAEYIDSARIYCKLAESKVAEAYNYLMHSDVEDVDLFKKGRPGGGDRLIAVGCFEREAVRCTGETFEFDIC